MAQLTKISADSLRPGPATPGMARQEAFVSEGVWTGVVRTQPGMVSGWHHHGEHRTYIYVVSGNLLLESEDGEPVNAGPGDFVEVPPHTVHRESNPTDRESLAVLLRLGTGETVFNVEAPH